jgi:hypothetical protein
MNVAQLQDQLRQRAFLHDDPDAYLAGVDDALTVLNEEMVDLPQDESAETA